MLRDEREQYPNPLTASTHTRKFPLLDFLDEYYEASGENGDSGDLVYPLVDALSGLLYLHLNDMNLQRNVVLLPKLEEQFKPQLDSLRERFIEQLSGIQVFLDQYLGQTPPILEPLKISSDKTKSPQLIQLSLTVLGKDASTREGITVLVSKDLGSSDRAVVLHQYAYDFDTHQALGGHDFTLLTNGYEVRGLIKNTKQDLEAHKYSAVYLRGITHAEFDNLQLAVVNMHEAVWQRQADWQAAQDRLKK